MENATKAILIAGGIFFALITMSLLVVMFGNISKMEDAKADAARNEDLRAWNAEWEAYNKQVMYGSDIVTIVNKAAQWNHENQDDSRYKVTITVNGIDMNSELDENKLSIFTCESIHYNSETGRVDGMTFKFLRK